MENEKEVKNRFTVKQQQIIGDAIKKKLKNYKCVLCENTNWNLEPFMVNISVTSNLASRLGGEILPLVPITCTNCGNTHFLNLVTLGLLDIVKEGMEEKK